jgi:hypothetical protein
MRMKLVLTVLSVVIDGKTQSAPVRLPRGRGHLAYRVERSEQAAGRGDPSCPRPTKPSD